MVDLTVGIDEAGRGPLAGPLALAAVLGPVNYRAGSGCSVCKGVTDSKQLSVREREAIYACLTTHTTWAYTYISARSIDRHGIRPALDLAVSRVLKKILNNLAEPSAEIEVKLDGSLYAPAEYRYQETITRGDALEPVIGAASIIAKVRRDRMMERYGQRFPRYGFAKHKGYGTRAHREALSKYGPCPIHRRSFLKGLDY